MRIGGAEDSRLVVRTLASNRRVVCAAPSYLARRELPQTPADLVTHDCIVMIRGASGIADWALRPTARPHDALTSVRVRGQLVTDNGEQAHDWALAGLGLVRRSVWDLAAELADGSLVEVMMAWTGESAPIQVAFASRRSLPLRTRQFVDLLVAEFAHVQALQGAAPRRQSDSRQ